MNNMHFPCHELGVQNMVCDVYDVGDTRRQMQLVTSESANQLEEQRALATHNQRLVQDIERLKRENLSLGRISSSADRMPPLRPPQGQSSSSGPMGFSEHLADQAPEV